MRIFKGYEGGLYTVFFCDKMKDSVIRPGDRVVVIRMVRGYNRGTYYATVVRWTDGGRITVRSNNVKEGVKVVSPDNVKKR